MSLHRRYNEIHKCTHVLGSVIKILTINYNKYILPSHRDRMVRVQLRSSAPCLKKWRERKQLCFNFLPRSSTGGLRVQLLPTAGGAGGVAGGGWIPHQLTGKPLQRKPLRQHRLIPGVWETELLLNLLTPKMDTEDLRGSTELQDLTGRLFLCAPSSTSAPRRWRLQALAAAFTAVSELSLPDEKRTADYRTHTLPSHKAAGVACQVFFSSFSSKKPTNMRSIVEWQHRIQHGGFTFWKMLLLLLFLQSELDGNVDSKCVWVWSCLREWMRFLLARI